MDVITVLPDNSQSNPNGYSCIEEYMSQVTLQDVYQAINRVEDKMDARLKDMEKDIDELQTFQNRTMGMATVLAGFVSAAVTFVWNKITNQG